MIAPSVENRRPCSRESTYASRLTLPSVSSAIRTQNFSLPPVQKYQVSRPARWRKVQEEIKAELEQQRSSLLDLRHVLEPGLLKAKLALLGGPER